MGLKDIKIPETVIETPGGNFAVRGLSLDDVQYLVGKHGDELTALFNDFMKSSDAELSPEGIAGFLAPILRSMPELLSDIIACAAGSPEDAPIVRKMPFSVQIEALEPIANLCFNSAGGPKKFLETVVRMAQGTTGLVESLRA